MGRRLATSTTRALRDASERLVGSAAPIATAAAAAAVAWYLAHSVLGHQSPFFAPIAAAITLSTSQVQRTLRIGQLVAGVLLGIGIAEALRAVLGNSAVSLGVVVFVAFAMVVAIGTNIGGAGLMFANQTAASAILVLALHQQGTGADRAIDALIGGGVALIFGVVLFPAHPMKVLRDAEQGVLGSLADTLRQVVTRPAGQGVGNNWLSRQDMQVTGQLTVLLDSRVTALTITHTAPRRWPLRRTVTAEAARVPEFDSLAIAVLSLARTVTAPTGNPRPASLDSQLAQLADALERLATVTQPWPPHLVHETRRVTQVTIPQHAHWDPVVASLMQAVTTDLSVMLRPAATGG